jgi:hypothetical protein
MEELRYRIQLSQPPLRSEQELEEYFHILIRKIINIRPAIGRQLLQFLQAHYEIANATVLLNIPYRPTENLDENAKEILMVAEKSQKALSNFMKKPNNELSIYGLLFIHILTTESVTKHMLKGLDDLVRKCNLVSKYCAAGIFSIDFSIKIGNKVRSDAQIIRHALAHNKFDIVYKDRSWVIDFDNVAEDYVFRKTYTRNQFIEYLYNYNVLYRSTWMLTDITIAREAIKHHLIQKL